MTDPDSVPNATQSLSRSRQNRPELPAELMHKIITGCLTTLIDETLALEGKEGYGEAAGALVDTASKLGAVSVSTNLMVHDVLSKQYGSLHQAHVQACNLLPNNAWAAMYVFSVDRLVESYHNMYKYRSAMSTVQMLGACLREKVLMNDNRALRAENGKLRCSSDGGLKD